MTKMKPQYSYFSPIKKKKVVMIILKALLQRQIDTWEEDKIVMLSLIMACL